MAGDREELYTRVVEELEPLNMSSESTPPITVTESRYDPRQWVHRLLAGPGTTLYASYSPLLQRTTIYEDHLEDKARRKTRQKYEVGFSPADVEDTDLYREVLDELRLSTAAHETVHGRLHRSLGPARSRAYGFFGLTDSNVNEAAAQFFNLWFDGDVEDTEERYALFDRIESSYNHGTYDAGLITQYLAQGLNTYDETEGTPEDRAAAAMNFFEETYREQTGLPHLRPSRDVNLPLLSLGGLNGAVAAGGALNGNKLLLALNGMTAAVLLVNAIGAAPTWPDYLDPDDDARDLL